MNITPSLQGETPFQQILGHNPSVAHHWVQLEDSFFQHTSLGAELLEQVRRTLAFGNRCEYCMAKGRPAEQQSDRQSSYATAFAELFAQDHLSINAGHFDLLREVFTEPQIAELCSFISFISAAQRFGAIVGLR